MFLSQRHMTCEDLGLLILLQLCQHIIQAGDDDPVTCLVLWGMLSPSHQTNIRQYSLCWNVPSVFVAFMLCI